MTTPPSPLPPWHRPIQTPVVQIIYGDDTINLGVDVTYLEKTVSNPSVPVVVTLPDGNFLRQYHRILIAGHLLATSETFEVSGTFTGLTSLTFNSVGHSALLEWDGGGWTMLGGNAAVTV